MIFFVLMGFMAYGRVFANEDLREWSSVSEAGFSAHFELPTSPMVALEKGHVVLTLTYPATHHPDVDALKQHLQEHSVFKVAPFSLLDAHETVKEEDNGIKTSSIDFSLMAQLPGRYPITFYEIPFLPNLPSEKPVVILSGILHAQVSPPSFAKSEEASEETSLPFSPLWPLGLTSQNETILKEEMQKEPLRNQRIFEHAAIPWEHLCFAIFFLFLLGMVKKSLLLEEEIPPERRFAIAKYRAIDALNHLSQRPASPKEKYERTGEILRGFLVADHPRIFSRAATTEEYLKEIKEASFIHAELREPLTLFLRKSDLVQFAQVIPSMEEYEEADALTRKVVFSGKVSPKGVETLRDKAE
jgi:hypothetical protein